MMKIIENPKRLVLEISRNCNLRCRMCGFWGEIKPEYFIKPELIATIINAKKDIFSNLEEIRLNGRGESTIHPDFLNILKKIHKAFRNTRLTLFTNLMFNNDEILQYLNKYNVEIYVSVDSVKPKEYEYIRRNGKFQVLLKRIPKIKKGFIVFTLQQININEIYDVGKFAYNNGLGFILNVVHVDDKQYQEEFNNLLHKNWNNLLEQLSKLREIYTNNTLLIPDQIWGLKLPESLSTTITCGNLEFCPNILEEIMIGYNGDVYPCNMFNPFLYGNIFKSNLKDIWYSNKHIKFISEFKTHNYCVNCEYMIKKKR
ncbi:MAG: radical SAM/SPASM domain-containing protein [Promethearchaeota archaeon]